MINLEFSKVLQKGVDFVCKYYRDKIIIIYHNDTDGISSGAILKKVFERENCNVQLFCLEKLYPEIIEQLFKEKAVFVFGDLGSPYTKLLSEKNINNNKIIILDHHQVLNEVADNNIILINPEKYGYSGSTDIAGAGICFLFGMQFNSLNEDLIGIAILGNFEIPGDFQGLNKLIFDYGIKIGIVKVRQSLIKAETGLLLFDNKMYQIKELFEILNTLGSVGYYKKGFETGIQICLDGFTGDSRNFYNDLNTLKQVKFDLFLSSLSKNNYFETDHIVWCDAENIFQDMGNKIIGIFLSEWKKHLPKNLNKYIIGMMNLQNEIPDIGKIQGEYKKISGRLSENIFNDVLNNKIAPLSYIFENSASGVGGFGDGHKVAASAVIPRGSSREFIESAERYIKSYNKDLLFK